MRWLKALILSLFISKEIYSSKNCTGRIILEEFRLSDTKLIETSVNTPLVLKCELDKTATQLKCSASNLAYLIGGDTIAKNGIHYSGNSLYLKVNTSKATELTVSCTYNGFGLNSEVITINIGIKPQPINLNCLNFDLTDLVCDYNAPRNPVKENITIEMRNPTSELYELVHFEYYIESYTFGFIKDGPFNPFDRFKFRVTVANTIGPTLHQYFEYETEQIVGLPENIAIKLNNVTSNRATVMWELPGIFNKYEYFHTINLTGYYLRDMMPPDRIKTRNGTDHNITFELDISLPYAYTKYHLIIYTCVKNAVNPTVQQANGATKFESKMRIPDFPPQIIPGAFEYTERSGDVIIYWNQIATNLKNADNYAIKIHGILSNGMPNKNITATLSDTWALLQNLKPTSEYEVRLIAKNSEGISKNWSTMIIPKKSDLLDPPQNLKIVLNDNLYHLSWTTNMLVDNFTIIMCMPMDEQHSKCLKLLNTVTIGGNRSNFIYNNSFEDNSSKIFAISSNLNEKSSGIKWFICITSIKVVMAAIENVYIIHINGTAIKVKWTLPCSTSPLLTAIYISYCPISVHKNEVCENNIQRPTNLSSEVLIDNLVPYTNYSLALSMLDGHKIGPARHIQFETKFGMPDAPTEINFLNITNTSVVIYWTPPKLWYGIPHSYNVSYTSNLDSNILNIDTDENGLQNFTIIKNLRSSTIYTIQVAACHEICSRLSNKIVIKTKIGKPEKIRIIGRDEWSPPPEMLTSDFRLYEIKVDVIIDGKFESIYSLTAETKCKLANDVCNYNKSVRTIHLNEQFNTAKITKKYVITASKCVEDLKINYTELCLAYECISGDWVLLATGPCFSSYITQIIFYIFITLLILVAVAIIIEIVMKRYKKIVDLYVSLPFGLDSIFELQKQCDEQHTSNSIGDLNPHDELQIMTREELQAELELLGIPISGNYVDVNQLMNQDMQECQT